MPLTTVGQVSLVVDMIAIIAEGFACLGSNSQGDSYFDAALIGLPF